MFVIIYELAYALTVKKQVTASGSFWETGKEVVEQQGVNVCRVGGSNNIKKMEVAK